MFAIFGHGNVTCLGPALDAVKDVMPTWRGQNEQGMALAAVAFAKAKRRRQIMVATSSIGPGATNMVTAAAVAHANRLPVLLMAGDTFASRIPDPVLQQVEPFGDPSVTVNDAFKPVTRYWDRIVQPEQVVHSLPHAVATMLDPATCGPAFLALPQDVQAEAYDYPARFFEPTVHEIPRPRPDARQLDRAVEALAAATAPLIIAGGGVHYSFAEEELRAFAERHNIPVVETVAGKASLVAAHPLNAGPVGVTGCTSANALAGEADVVLAVGTRLQDFTTGSWTIFRNEAVRFVGLNTAGFDAVKHLALPLVADAREGLVELSARLGGWRGPDGWAERAATETAEYHRYIDKIASPTAPSRDERPTYAQVIGAIDRLAEPTDYALSAAGGFPGELNNGWRAKAVNTFDSEYGYSCMGYEISGGWGAKMAHAGPRGHRVRRRRLLPDDEQRPLQLGAVGPQADRDRVRQRRVRRDQPPAGQPGRGAVQQPPGRRQGGAGGRRRLRRPRRGDGLRRRAGEHDRRARGGVRPGPRRRPDDRDRDQDVGLRVDRGRLVLGGRRAGGQRPRRHPPGARRPRGRQGRAAGRAGERGGRRRQPRRAGDRRHRRDPRSRRGDGASRRRARRGRRRGRRARRHPWRGWSPAT